MIDRREKFMKEIEKCQYCGNDKFVEGKQFSQGAVYPKNKFLTFHYQILYHIICVNCGAIVKSYVKNPKELMIKK